MKAQKVAFAAACVVAVLAAGAALLASDGGECGPIPRLIPWSGALFGLAGHLARTADDPNSVEVSDCEATGQSAPPVCWAFECTVREKNSFGALVAKRFAVRLSTGWGGLASHFISAVDVKENAMLAEAQAVEKEVRDATVAPQWHATIYTALSNALEICRVDCAEAAVYMHPARGARLVEAVRRLSPQGLSRLAVGAATASFLDGSQYASVAAEVGATPQKCVRVDAGSTSAIACSVPDTQGVESLKLVDLTAP